jgi:hypothetical protein
MLGGFELRLDNGKGESVYAGNCIIGDIIGLLELSLDEEVGI